MIPEEDKSIAQSLPIQVASIFRNEVLSLLDQELNSLRTQIRSAKTLQVTGKHGIPVYAQGQLDFDGNRCPDGYSVELEDTFYQCPLSNLNNVEIRIEGKVVAEIPEGFIEQFDVSEGADFEGDEQRAMFRIL